MNIEKWLRLVAGAAVLISITLGLTVNAWWFAFTAFVGVNLLQSGFTNWCPVKWALERMGVPPCA